jgi:sulfur-oxidizing protein SoxX
MRIRSIVTCCLSIFVFCAPVCAQQAAKEPPGKALVFGQAKGNCLACHGFPGLGAELTGNAGPPLIAMQARFPDKGVLRAKIWDATTTNPASFMPPFGKHGILAEEEIDQVVEFVHGL